MAVNEVSGVLTKVDAEGNRTLMYPITKTENVDGLPDELAGLEETAATAARQADEAKSTAAAAQTTADAAMPKSGGTFTGGVSAAMVTNDGEALLRNIVVIDANTDLPTLSVPAGTIVMVRK